jgi:toxin HigB-1
VNYIKHHLFFAILYAGLKSRRLRNKKLIDFLPASLIFVYLLGKLFLMDIAFKNKKLMRIFNSEALLRTEYQKEQAAAIIRRMSVLRSAPNLESVPHLPPEKRHELKGARKGDYAVNLKQPYRLTFRPNNFPLPLKDDGGIDLKRVTAILILDVEDYH